MFSNLNLEDVLANISFIQDYGFITDHLCYIGMAITNYQYSLKKITVFTRPTTDNQPAMHFIYIILHYLQLDCC